MSLAEHTVGTVSGSVARTPDVRDVFVPYRWHVYGACVALAIACNYVLGKDMAWDTLNYHLYSGFSALNDRFGQDYFAAGPPTYFNPYAYVPFYAMVHAGLPALAICSVFAAVHSMILWLTFELGVTVCPSEDARSRLLAGGCAVALAFMNPVLMQEIGSCFADITTAEMALAGWVLLASAIRVPRTSRVIWAGLILGAASALKLSNLLPAASAFAMLIMLPLSWRGRIRNGFLYGISLGIGFVIAAAPWSYRLEKMFGNPLFPLFNNVFRSPEFTTEPMVHHRFIPGSIGEALWRPFAMINPMRMIHEEPSAPDPRYAILIGLVILLLLRWVWRRLGRISPSPSSLPLKDSTRVLVALACGLCLNWIIWLQSSGNSRYFLATACVAAAVIVGLLFRLFESRPKVRNYILIIIFVTQAVQLYMGAEYRWNEVPWGGAWFNVSVPEKLQSQPNLYLTMGAQSNSFLVPFLAKESGFVNFSGGYTFDPDGANGLRLKSLIQRYSPNLRVLARGEKLYENSERRAPRRSEVDDALQWYGLRTDMSDCAKITVHGLPPDFEFHYGTSLAAAPRDPEESYFVSCHVIRDPTDLSALIARRRAVDVVFDRMEDACPKLFQPRRLVTVHDGDVWRRVYGGSDLSAWISYGRVKFGGAARPGEGFIEIGRESDWAKGPLHLDCGSRKGVYFAHVLP
jgi:hypothetical protein